MIEKIKQIVGENNVSDKEIDRIVYSYDSSPINGSANLIVWPTDEMQIRRLVLLCNNKNVSIVPRGSGTSLTGSSVPESSEVSIVIDTSKMNKILKINLKEKSVIVQPGVILNDLNITLKKFNLFFPVIPSSHKICSIGGMVSTNAVGNRAVKYGRTSDWVLDLEFIDGTGKHITPKEIQSFIGKEGNFGIITKIKLKLTEPIQQFSLSMYDFEDITDLINKVSELKKNSNLIALEFLDKLTSELIINTSKFHLIAEFESGEGDFKEPQDIIKIWKLRESIGPILTSKNYTLIEDPQIPLKNLPLLLKWSKMNNLPLFGHIGLGIFHIRFKNFQKPLIKDLFTMVKNLGGNISGEHGMGITKRDYIDDSYLNKIKEIKKQYDPKNIFNRGKVI